MNTECTNTDGSYTCSCTPGYSGDGMNCSGECMAVMHHTCMPVVAKYGQLLNFAIMQIITQLKSAMVSESR